MDDTNPISCFTLNRTQRLYGFGIWYDRENSRCWRPDLKLSPSIFSNALQVTLEDSVEDIHDMRIRA